MTTLPDQLTAAGKQQLASQIAFFQRLSSEAFARASRVLALNVDTSRATLEQSASTVRQLLAVRDPRDLLALSAHAQQQMAAALAYSRQLFDIASSTPAPSTPPFATARPVHVAEEVADQAAEPAEDAAPMHASAILPSKHPMGEAEPVPTPAIDAMPTPIARAVSEVTDAPAETAHPAASPLPPSGPITLAPVDTGETPPAARGRSKTAGSQPPKPGRKR